LRFHAPPLSLSPRRPALTSTSTTATTPPAAGATSTRSATRARPSTA
jgi:hypothetical protein